MFALNEHFSPDKLHSTLLGDFADSFAKRCKNVHEEVGVRKREQVPIAKA